MNEITVEQQEQIKAETHDLVVRATELIIVTERDNTKAATLTATIKAELKKRKASDLYLKTKESKDAAKSAFDSLEEIMIDPLNEAVKIITPKIGAFVQAENRRRAELQRIEDARVAALQAKEDAKAAEAQRKADEAYAAKCAKAALANKPTPVAPAPVAAPVIVPQRTIAAVSAPTNTTYRDNWSAKVIDIKALCAAVVAGTVDSMSVKGDGVYLNGLAKLKKIEGEIAPGVIGVKIISTTQR